MGALIATAPGNCHRFGAFLSIGILSACALHSTPAQSGTPVTAHTRLARTASEPGPAAAPEVQAPAEPIPTETPDPPADATPPRTPVLLSGADAPVQITIGAARLVTQGLVLQLRVYNRTKVPLRWLNTGVIRRFAVTTSGGEVEVEHSEPRDYLPTFAVLADECEALQAPLILPHQSISITMQSLVPADSKAVDLDVEIDVGAPDCEVASIVRERVARCVQNCATGNARAFSRVPEFIDPTR